MQEETKELTKVNNDEHLKMLQDYLDTFGFTNKIPEADKKKFILIASAFKLNPFKREIYCVPYRTQDGKVSLNIITGYEVYIKRAERTGLLNGWSVEILEAPIRAKITIHRKDWAKPFVHEVLMQEYKQKNRMWDEKPYTMLKKVAIAQGFRLAFPEECAGMPYTSDELPVNDNTYEEIKNQEKIIQPASQAIEIAEMIEKETQNKQQAYNTMVRAIDMIPKDAKSAMKIVEQLKIDWQNIKSRYEYSPKEIQYIEDKLDEATAFIRQDYIEKTLGE